MDAATQQKDLVIKPYTAIAEGRLAEGGILISTEKTNDIGRLGEEDSDPVVITFYQDNGNQSGYFIRLNDHRAAVIAAFEKAYPIPSDSDEYFDVWKEFDQVFQQTPGLISFRVRKGTQYIVIVDLGTPDFRDEGEYWLVYTEAFDREHLRIATLGQIGAVHATTQIGVAVKRNKPKSVFGKQPEVLPGRRF